MENRAGAYQCYLFDITDLDLMPLRSFLSVTKFGFERDKNLTN